MNKRTLYVMLVLDLLLIVSAMYFIFNELNSKKSLQTFSNSAYRTKTEKPAASSTARPLPPAATPAKPASAAVDKSIRFTYRNSRPKSVAIFGEFNDWKPAPMVKGKNHTWSITLSLKLGNYLYGYIVDGRFINDPNNKNTGTGIDGKKCSLLKVTTNK